MLRNFLFDLPDHRRKQGQRYQLGHILLFTLLAMLSQADSYRKIAAFITVHYATLDQYFKLNWKRQPSYNTIRYIINVLNEIQNKFWTPPHKPLRSRELWRFGK